MKLQHKVIAVILAFLTITWLMPPDFNLSKIGDNRALAEASMLSNKAAVAAAKKANSSDTNNMMNNYALDSSNIVGEITSKRDKYIRQFRMNDGTIQAVMYSSAVNYKKADGTWADVDNSLEQTKDKAGNSIYKTKDNGYMNVAFANDSKSDNLVSIIKDKYSISWKLNKANVSAQRTTPIPSATTGVDPTIAPTLEPTSALTSEPTLEPTLEPTFAPVLGTDSNLNSLAISSDNGLTAESTVSPDAQPALNLTAAPDSSSTMDSNTTNDSLMSVVPAVIDDFASKKASLTGNALKRLTDKASSHIQYKGIASNVSLDYVVEAERIKENITLASYIPNFSISFDIAANGLTTKEKEGGIIAFCDGDNEVFYLMPSYALDKDSNDAAVKTSLQPIKDGYRLTLTPDDNWMSKASYPVIIDPQLQVDWDASNINDTYVASEYPNTQTWYGYASLRLGHSSTYGDLYVLVKYLNLPALASSKAVVGAFMITERDNDQSTTTNQYTLHRITANWNQTSVTWGNKPSFDSTVEEEHTVSNANGGRYYFYTWDITDLVRGWYTGAYPNYGLLIKGTSTTNGYRMFYSANATYVSDAVQTIIQYVDTAGLEGNWSYQSMDARRAGTANVNLFTGNLVVSRDDVGTSGNRMPVSISHVYNAVNKDDTDMGYGMGWRLNYAQTIVGETISGVQYYDYTDEDGTVHYFRHDTGSTYIDESGQNRTLAINTGSTTARYTITDKNDNVMTFDFVDMPGTTPDYGRLVKISDCIGNYISISYNGTSKKIASITDGANRVYTLSYYNNGAGDLQTITAPGNRIVGFDYDAGNRLYHVTDPDNQQSTYSYDTTAGMSNNALTGLRNYDAYHLVVSYNTKDFMYPKVSQIDEWGNDTTQGGSQTFTYSEKETKVVDHLGNVNIYQFNQYGNTVTIQDDKGRAVYSQFYNPSAATSDSGTYGQNKMSLSSRLEEPVMNLAQNNSFETSGSWSSTKTNSNDTSTFITAQHYVGNTSLQLYNPASSDNVTSQTISLVKGSTYTLSAYVKTLDVNGNYGATVSIKYLDSSNNPVYSDKQPILNGTNDWTRIDTTVKIPDDASSSNVDIIMELNGSTGTAWFDGVQLEKQPVVNKYNMVQNGDMTFSTSGTPNFWAKSSGCTTSDASTTTADTDRGLLDNNVFHIVGSFTADKSISQTIMVSGVTGDSFSFGGWGKATAIPLGTKYPVGNTSYGRQFGIRVDLKNGSTAAGTVTVPFNDFSNLWQYLSGRVIATGTYDRAIITVLYENEVNDAYFDGIELYKEEFGQFYDYDKDGNLISATDLLNDKSSVTYDDNNNPKTIQPPDCSDTELITNTYYNQTGDTAGWKHLLKTTETAAHVRSSYNYDSFGNMTIAETKDDFTNPTAYIRSKLEYTDNGNYIKKSYDALGNYTQYNYEANSGVNLSTTDPGSQTVSYTYDGNNSAIQMGKLTKVKATVNSVDYENDYGYTNDRLTQITHNGFNYSICYNLFGQTETVNVAGQNLITNTYITTPLNKASFLLEQSAYGNGGLVKYDYDERYRLSAIAYDNEDIQKSPRFTYTYAANNQLGSTWDNQNNLTTNIYYDLANRPMKTVEKYDSGLRRIFQYSYDIDNCLTHFQELFGATQYNTVLEYDKDNRVTAVSYNPATDPPATGSQNVRYAYDKLGRLDTRKLKLNTGDYTLTYGYIPGHVADDNWPAGSTTGMISSISYNGTSSLSYTYDDCGRISTVSDGPNTIHYTYDGLGQLIRTDDPTDTRGGATGSTWTYAYDAGGNITTKKLYAFCPTDTDLSNNTEVDSIPYAYDTTWKDKLMSYDGDSITYDDIGNPLIYNGWTYTWEAGRQLKQMVNGGTTLQFKYNASGLRTQKINGSTTTKYYWNGSVLGDMTDGTNALHFWYDAAGMPAMVTYNGTNYYYKENLQGDIIGLLDMTGATVVSYIYDSWGKQLSCTGSLANTLGVVNPLRYRGYIFDNETGLYYLQSRYYKPEWGRFINADDIYGSISVINSHNIFIYCSNSPTNLYDPDGEDPASALLGTKIHQAISEQLRGKGYICNSTIFPGLKLRPDVTDQNTKEFWEIKPDSTSGKLSMLASLQKYSINKYTPGGMRPDLWGIVFVDGVYYEYGYVAQGEIYYWMLPDDVQKRLSDEKYLMKAPTPQQPLQIDSSFWETLGLLTVGGIIGCGGASLIGNSNQKLLEPV